MLTLSGTAERATEVTARRAEVASRIASCSTSRIDNPIDNRVESGNVVGKADDDPVIRVHDLGINPQSITQVPGQHQGQR